MSTVTKAAMPHLRAAGSHIPTGARRKPKRKAVVDGGTATCALASPDAAFSAVLHAPGIPPFVVWSKRTLVEAATDAISDAVRCLNGTTVARPVHSAAPDADSTPAARTPFAAPPAATCDPPDDAPLDRRKAPSRPAYHAEASL